MCSATFFTISKTFVNFILAQYIITSDSIKYFNDSFETEKRLRVSGLFQPQIRKQSQGGYYSNQDNFISSVVYLILPNKFNEYTTEDFFNSNWSGIESNSNKLLNELRNMAVYLNRTLFCIDCASTSDISHWHSLCGSSTNIFPYQRVLICLRNIHMMERNLSKELHELLHYGLYNLREQVMRTEKQQKEFLLSNNNNNNNKLGIRFDILIDFTCCHSKRQISSLYYRLPSWLRLYCLPLSFTDKDDQSSFVSSRPAMMSKQDQWRKSNFHSVESFNQSLDKNISCLWLKEHDNIFEKLESE
ncbi:unnamed protein product [Trichobilharzia regenti]|nr:unnamed protein product [Trichobilharzia regenti]